MTESAAPCVGVVIVAAGASRRMVGVDKTWAVVNGQPIVAHTVQVFVASPHINDIVLVVAADRVAQAQQLALELGWQKVRALVAGGARRRDSVLAGLEALPPTDGIVLIHDGARPLVTDAIIAAGLRAVAQTGAAIPGVPVKDTIKRVDAQGIIIETPDRATLYTVQTPQIFDRALILAAHRSVDSTLDVTDDARLAELQGHQVCIFPGAYTNIKITTPEDLAIAQALWGVSDSPVG